MEQVLHDLLLDMLRLHEDTEDNQIRLLLEIYMERIRQALDAPEPH